MSCDHVPTSYRPLAQRKIGWPWDRWALSVLVLATACRPKDGSEAPDTADAMSRQAGIQILERSVEPPMRPATAYGSNDVFDATVSERAIRELLADVEADYDPSLSCLVRGLAAFSPAAMNMPSGLVEGLSSWCGVYDPPPRIIVVELPVDPVDCSQQSDGPCAEPIASLVEEVRGSLPEPPGRRYGVGAAHLEGGTTRLLVGLTRRAVELETIPRMISASDPIHVRGLLLGGRTQPRVDVIAPDGEWRRFPALLASDQRFAVSLTCHAGRGIYKLEVLVEGEHGTEVAANFPVYCGVEPARTIDFEIEHIDPSLQPGELAHLVFLYLNEARAARHLPALVWNDKAAEVARQHSQDMSSSGFVGHVSPRTGDATERFAVAKLRSVVLRENVARGYGPKGIHESLMGSPGHRVNILADDVTHCGVGVVIGEPESADGDQRPLFVTQNFYRPPDAVGPADLAAGLLRDVDAQRAQRELPALQWSKGLIKVAQQQAEAQVTGEPVDDSDIRDAVFELGFHSVTRHEAFAEDYRAVVDLDVWQEITTAEAVGVGISRVPATGDSPAGFTLVILIATK